MKASITIPSKVVLACPGKEWAEWSTSVLSAVQGQVDVHRMDSFSESPAVTVHFDGPDEIVRQAVRLTMDFIHRWNGDTP